MLTRLTVGMSEDDSFESERPRSRSEIAAVFRSVADQLDAGGAVTVGDDDRSVAVSPPERPMFEIEIEREASDDTEEVSFELEIEWTEQAGEAASSATAETEDERAVDDTDGAAKADIETEVDTIESLGRFEIFRDRAEEWRWRLVHRNGNIIATSGEGYTSRQNALKGMRSVMRNAPDAEVVSK